MSTSEDPRPALAAAEDDLAEAERLSKLANTLRDQGAHARSDADAAQRQLGVEAGDVEKLERVSFARVWASLRGDAAERLERERGEEQAARYRLDVAVDRHEALLRQTVEIERRRAQLGDVAARHIAVRDRVHAWVMSHGGPAADTLSETMRRVAVIEAEQREVQEALTAAEATRAPLEEAARLLESASGWSTYDTFFSGGVVADLVKRDRMDAAADQLRTADKALRYLSAELADLGQSAEFAIVLPEGLHIFDLWFDDVFSSWAVHNRIGDAQARVAETQRAVEDVAQRLTAQAREIATALARAEQQRAEILRG